MRNAPSANDPLITPASDRGLPEGDRNGFACRRLTLPEMDEAATVHRRAFDDRLPWLAGLHSAADDLFYFRRHVFETCALWGAECEGAIVGILALRDDWIDHLYVLPDQQGRGVGSALLGIARREMSELSLWTFQRNRGARAFYERQGFVEVEQTDGAGNGEHEPDVRYHWVRKRRPVRTVTQAGRTLLSLRVASNP